MASLSQNANSILASKKSIRQAILAAKVIMPNTAIFKDYPVYIGNIMQSDAPNVTTVVHDGTMFGDGVLEPLGVRERKCWQLGINDVIDRSFGVRTYIFKTATDPNFKVNDYVTDKNGTLGYISSIGTDHFIVVTILATFMTYNLIKGNIRDNDKFSDYVIGEPEHSLTTKVTTSYPNLATEIKSFVDMYSGIAALLKSINAELGPNLTIVQSLTRLSITRSNIRIAIENKGIAVNNAAEFREYPVLIENIQLGADHDINSIQTDGSLIGNGTDSFPLQIRDINKVAIQSIIAGDGLDRRFNYIDKVPTNQLLYPGDIVSDQNGTMAKVTKLVENVASNMVHCQTFLPTYMSFEYMDTPNYAIQQNTLFKDYIGKKDQLPNEVKYLPLSDSVSYHYDYMNYVYKLAQEINR